MRANIPKGMGGGPQSMQAIARQAQKMQEARQSKDYAAADALRAEILAAGYSVMITKDGVTVKKN